LAPKDDSDDSSGFTGKRNKSFRELDAQRGKSKYHSRQDDPSQQRIERSASYEKYKKAADSLFSGGAVPVGLQHTLDPDGKRKDQKAALQKITAAPDRKAWTELVVDYLSKNELPEDAFFLDSLLNHPASRVVEQAMAKLEQLTEDGKLTKGKAPKSLEQRLKTHEMTSLDSEIQSRSKALRQKLF
jgi:hypothetical protein